MINRSFLRLAASAGIALSVLALSSTVRPLEAGKDAGNDARKEAQPQAAVRVPRPVLERYVGEYLYPDGATFTVGLDGDTLVQVLPQRRLAYTPLSETLFMLGPVFTAEFVVDQAGGLTQILSDGAGVEYRLRRKGSPPEPPPAPPVPVHVPRAVLERYVGVYEYIPGQMQRTDLRITIRLKGDTLVREMGPEAVLTPISETRFRVGHTSIMVEFVVDEAGVTQILGSGFQQMLARLTSKR
jgi:hypothetical protein